MNENHPKINKEINSIVNENLKKLQAVFPSVVKDGKLDITALKEELGVFEELKKGDEKYTLNWVGKQNAVKEYQKDLTGKTLKYAKGEGVNEENTQNIYIEGDNLEVLKLLKKNYNGEIKMIYIDPPYNTGNDFVYDDDFSISKEEAEKAIGIRDKYNEKLQRNTSDADKYHSKWLNMMYPRLKLARDLLSEDGVIFISIDDHEQANLKKICDEIFGEENFIATLKWKKKKQPSFLSKVADVIEYIHIYSKKYEAIGQLCAEKLTDSDKPIVNASNKPCERIIRKGTKVKADVSFIPKGLVQNRTAETEYLDDVSIVNGRTANDVRIIAKFRTTQEGIDEFCKRDLLFITKNLGLRRDLSEKEKEQGKAITDLILDWGQNQDATNELKKLFSLSGDKTIFSNPKPVFLLTNLIKTSSDNVSIVLDFFSGSATTAHAVMQLNAEDGGKRKYIMVQLPENLDENLKKATSNEKQTIQNAIKFCDENGFPHSLTEIGKERIRRAGKQIKEENPDKNIDIGFKVFKVAETNLNWEHQNLQGKDLINNYKADSSNKDKLDFTPNFTDIDVVYEIMLRQEGLPLTSKIEQLTDIGNRTYYIAKSLVICLEENITNEMVEKLSKITPADKFIFRDSTFETNISLKGETFNRLSALIDKNSSKKNAYKVEFI